MEKSCVKDFKDCLIPKGMILDVFFKPSYLIVTVSLGIGIGYMIGVTAYSVYSKKKELFIKGVDRFEWKGFSC